MSCAHVLGAHAASGVGLQDFHSKYYHPSNARFWFHGDDAPVERLRILAEYLDEFERKEVRACVGVFMCVRV